MSKHRRSPPVLLGAVLLLWVSVPARPAVAATTQLDATTMKAALRCETPGEKGFVERVVRLMNKGKLPRSVVETTFDWARRKNKHRFQYFQEALTLQAKRLGLSLDEPPEKAKSHWQWTFPWYVAGS